MLWHVLGFLLHQTSWAEFVKTWTEFAKAFVYLFVLLYISSLSCAVIFFSHLSFLSMSDLNILCNALICAFSGNDHRIIVQGPSWQTGFFHLALTDRNTQVRFCLKVVLKFWDLRNFASTTSFYEMHTVRHLQSNFQMSLVP